MHAVLCLLALMCQPRPACTRCPLRQDERAQGVQAEHKPRQPQHDCALPRPYHRHPGPGKGGGQGAGGAVGGCTAGAVYIMQLCLSQPGCYALPATFPHPSHLLLQYVALERPLPFAIRQDFAPQLLPQKGTVYESGLEGVTFQFRWAYYGSVRGKAGSAVRRSWLACLQ